MDDVFIDAPLEITPGSYLIRSPNPRIKFLPPPHPQSDIIWLRRWVVVIFDTN
jgi:hypothetical protein